jgi:hypothetical protein
MLADTWPSTENATPNAPSQPRARRARRQNWKPISNLDTADGLEANHPIGGLAALIALPIIKL